MQAELKRLLFINATYVSRPFWGVDKIAVKIGVLNGKSVDVLLLFVCATQATSPLKSVC